MGGPSTRLENCLEVTGEVTGEVQSPAPVRNPSCPDNVQAALQAQLSSRQIQPNEFSREFSFC